MHENEEVVEIIEDYLHRGHRNNSTSTCHPNEKISVCIRIQNMNKYLFLWFIVFCGTLGEKNLYNACACV